MLLRVIISVNQTRRHVGHVRTATVRSSSTAVASASTASSGATVVSCSASIPVGLIVRILVECAASMVGVPAVHTWVGASICTERTAKHCEVCGSQSIGLLFSFTENALMTRLNGEQTIGLVRSW